MGFPSSKLQGVWMQEPSRSRRGPLRAGRLNEDAGKRGCLKRGDLRRGERGQDGRQVGGQRPRERWVGEIDGRGGGERARCKAKQTGKG